VKCKTENRIPNTENPNQKWKSFRFLRLFLSIHLYCIPIYLDCNTTHATHDYWCDVFTVSTVSASTPEILSSILNKTLNCKPYVFTPSWLPTALAAQTGGSGGCGDALTDTWAHNTVPLTLQLLMKIRTQEDSIGDVIMRGI